MNATEAMELGLLNGRIQSLIRGFNSENSNGCHYCGSYFNFSEESDDVALLSHEIIKLVFNVSNI